MTRLIALPTIDWHEVTLKPHAPALVDRMEGRRTETVRQGTTWWTGSWQSVQLSREDLGRIDAWHMDASDGAVFRAHDVLRPRPLAHDNGQPLSGTRAIGGAFDGTASLNAIASSRRGATVAGLPANFQLLAGDYIEFRMSAALVSLHMVTADVKAGSNGVAVVAFRYELDAAFTVASTVNLEKPACLMQIDPGTYNAPKAGNEWVASFTAAEVFPEEIDP